MDMHLSDSCHSLKYLGSILETEKCTFVISISIPCSHSLIAILINVAYFKLFWFFHRQLAVKKLIKNDIYTLSWIFINKPLHSIHIFCTLQNKSLSSFCHWGMWPECTTSAATKWLWNKEAFISEQRF